MERFDSAYCVLFDSNSHFGKKTSSKASLQQIAIVEIHSKEIKDSEANYAAFSCSEKTTSFVDLFFRLAMDKEKSICHSEKWIIFVLESDSKSSGKSIFFMEIIDDLDKIFQISRNPFMFNATKTPISHFYLLDGLSSDQT
mmetsp:Transcript_21440/g.48576  ORF Transcript_21440/g.48576 Transcript_21440/m.48576 type:complete len:141 (+) Transcript_21440:721-1143(+)|eukprot:754887-Hanusia_phi.AAC.2